MAQRRMFNKKIVDTDAFLDMPISTRLLYYDLAMRADDDGFIDGPKKIAKMIGCSTDDLNLLVAKNYLIPFESGVCVIRHWLVHNQIRKDRRNPTLYTDELSQLSIDEQSQYVCDNHTETTRQPDDNQMRTQVRLGKGSSGSSGSSARASEDDIELPNHDPEFGRVIKAYCDNVGGYVPMLEEYAAQWLKDTCVEAVMYAIEQAAVNGGKTIKYVNRVVQRMVEAGVKDAVTTEQYKRDWEAKKTSNPSPPPQPQQKKKDNPANHYPQRETQYADQELFDNI